VTDSSSFTFKKNHVYFFAGILIVLFALKASSCFPNFSGGALCFSHKTGLLALNL